MSKVTLQINLSPGDIDYAKSTVPLLLRAHLSEGFRTLAVVDCCRPQRTRIVDPDKRFPEDSFKLRVERIVEIAETFRADGIFDRVEYLMPDSEIVRVISRKWLGGLVSDTHDYGACGLMSYLSAFELSDTQYLLHYDADMLLYQHPDFSWPQIAIEHLERDPTLLVATPRVSPPGDFSGPSLHEWPPFKTCVGGWRDTWLSTRSFLIDRSRLLALLPLLQGRYALESWLRRLTGRGYPRSPEVMLSRRLQQEKLARLTLESTRAWLLHPLKKGDAFLQLLPNIQRNVQAGLVPDNQKGLMDVALGAWKTYLSTNELAAPASRPGST